MGIVHVGGGSSQHPGWGQVRQGWDRAKTAASRGFSEHAVRPTGPSLDFRGCGFFREVRDRFVTKTWLELKSRPPHLGPG